MLVKYVFAKPLLAILILLLLLTGLSLITPARAAPSLRAQVNQHGDFTMIGNTLGYECAAGTPAPVVGTVGACGTNTADSAPDVFWRSDSPADGQAEANTGITVAQARSTAVLTLPAGAQVTHAYLYWAAQLATADSDNDVTLDRPGSFSAAVTALQSLTAAGNRYRSVADVTALVQTNGSGAYRLSDLDTVSFVNLNNSNVFGAWWMVVLYRLDTDPLRNLTIYDGFDGVANGLPLNITLSDFIVPTGSSDAKLGVVTLDGDNATTGDALAFNGTTLSDAQNPANNFFNGTRSYLGSPVSVTGDLPQLTGTAQSMSGIDLDVVNVTPYLTAGQTSAPISATTTGDVFFPSTFVTSITTTRPDLSTSTKTAVDLNGGAVLPGDVIEYTIAMTNTGDDRAILAGLNDPLPAGVTYVPGSLAIVSGANAGAMTDASGDDQAEYVVASRSVIARLGTNADAAQGGALNIGSSTTLRFHVTIDASCAGPADIANQASITTAGQLGAAQSSSVTDGNGAAAGNPPTIFSTNFQCLTVSTAGAGSGTVTSAPAGIDCGEGCQIFPNNTLVTLTANPDASSTFAGWSGAATGTTNPISINVNAQLSVTAAFTAVPTNTPTDTPTPTNTPTNTPTPTDTPVPTSTPVAGLTHVYLPLIRYAAPLPDLVIDRVTVRAISDNGLPERGLKR